ncbi:hypothetical protein M407DRAFT_22855 [Tulasnella calospora MUT 4182]|uniref:Uncharacterized protein n=1 Tax=Tulasnella calospora MUT 4182 TaxID=1051891 RepID=A0A0C3QKM3_9AGAM|nr:hypothetical protein M407DRAFT_22855 [Tulasnella calospora MUT 4182]
MNQFEPSVVLPPIRHLFDEVQTIENQRAAHHTYTPFAPIHGSVGHPLHPFLWNGSNASPSLQWSLPIPSGIPSHSRPAQEHSRLQSSYLGIPQNDAVRPSPSPSVTRWDHRSPKVLRPSPSSSSNSFETSSPSASSHSLPSVPPTPRLQHSPAPDVERVGIRELEDAQPLQAMDLQPDQVAGPCPVPPQSVLEPILDHHALFAFRLSADYPPSPSLSISSSIEGSPRTAEGCLPFALVPAVPNHPASLGPLPETQTTPQKHGEKAKSAEDHRVPRIDAQLTKNGAFYTRCRPEDLQLPPGRKLKTQKKWTHDEISTAMDALEWYKSWNSDFMLSKCSKEEQQVALPIIFRYIIGELNTTNWRRGYDGFLTWASKSLDRPTYRKPVGHRSTNSKPARKPKQPSTKRRIPVA